MATGAITGMRQMPMHCHRLNAISCADTSESSPYCGGKQRWWWSQSYRLNASHVAASSLLCGQKSLTTPSQAPFPTCEALQKTTLRVEGCKGFKKTLTPTVYPLLTQSGPTFFGCGDQRLETDVCPCPSPSLRRNKSLGETEVLEVLRVGNPIHLAICDDGDHDRRCHSRRFSGTTTSSTAGPCSSAERTSAFLGRWGKEGSRRHQCLPASLFLNSRSKNGVCFPLSLTLTLTLTLCARRVDHITSVGAVTGCEESVGLGPANESEESGDKSRSSSSCEEAGVWSVVIPTYNRLPILTKCLCALEHQLDATEHGIKEYEVVVIDDGSDDGTVEFLQTRMKGEFRHVRLLQQEHAGAAAARNMGVAAARGEVIVFIDSDLVVTPSFLQSHARMLCRSRDEDGDDRSFTYGRVVNTSNFDCPESEPFKISDFSAAFFATGNVAISRLRLLHASSDAAALPTSKNSSSCGPFDTSFSEYGWEDLELGERLRQKGAKLRACPEAVGYHWHPPFSVSQLPLLIEQERQRGRNGVQFYRKHPNLNVRLMIQMTLFHETIWFILTIGGLVNERTMAPLLQFLVNAGMPRLAAALISPILNWHNVQAVRQEVRRIKQAGGSL